MRPKSDLALATLGKLLDLHLWVSCRSISMHVGPALRPQLSPGSNLHRSSRIRDVTVTEGSKEYCLLEWLCFQVGIHENSQHVCSFQLYRFRTGIFRLRYSYQFGRVLPNLPCPLCFIKSSIALPHLTSLSSSHALTISARPNGMPVSA